MNGRPLSALATEDLILFLYIHGAKHGWPLLSWICDLAGLIHRGVGIGWSALLFRAEASQYRRALLLGLKLAHELIGVPIPLGIPGRDAHGLGRQSPRTPSRSRNVSQLRRSCRALAGTVRTAALNANRGAANSLYCRSRNLADAGGLGSDAVASIASRSIFLLDRSAWLSPKQKDHWQGKTVRGLKPRRSPGKRRSAPSRIARPHACCTRARGCRFCPRRDS